MLQYLVIVWGIINLAFTSFYIREILKGRTKPNRVTWLMWSIAPLIAFTAAFSDGIRRAALPVFMSWFAPLLVFLSSFINKKAYRKLKKIDYSCGISSVLALVLWRITKEPAIAIIFAILSDTFAAIPTVIKGWKHPKTESIAPFIGWLFSASTSFFALKMFNFTELAFPIYLILMNIILISTISFGKARKKKKNNKIQ